jgi:O-antigen/teichoic acid export membrane protein
MANSLRKAQRSELTGSVDGEGATATASITRYGRAFLNRLRSFDHLVALIDQASMAITRLGGLLVFARLMSIDAFGALALVVSISFMLNNAQRSLVILPYILACKNSKTPEAEGAAWFWIDLIVSAVVCVALLAGWGGAMALGAAHWVDYALFYSALGAPPLMAFTFLRRWAYQNRTYRLVLWMVIAYMAAFGVGVAAAWWWRDLEFLPFLAIGGAPLAGLVAGTIGGRDHWTKPPRDLLRRWRKTVRFSTWSFLSFLAGAVYTNGMNIVTASVIGAAGSAAFGATRTLVAPVVTLTSASDMIDKPRASRAFLKNGVAGLRRVVRGTMGFLLALGMPYLLLVFVFSGELLQLLYGQKYAGLETELRVWVFAMLFQMMANPLATHLLILADSRSVFLACLTGALVTLGIAAVALPLYGTVVVALVAMATGRAVNIILLYAMTRRRSGPPPQRRAPVAEEEVTNGVDG